MEKLDEHVKSRQKEVVSVQESEKAVAARTEVEAMPKAS
jgi:hypothetical protein